MVTSPSSSLAFGDFLSRTDDLRHVSGSTRPSSRGTARREAETGYRQPDDLGRRGPAAGAAVTQQRAAFQETFLNACQTETVR